jgi:2-methylfumaryl-CoA hydratase
LPPLRADTFAHSLGFPRAPVDNLLAFNVVFGKTVPDISLNAVANLGYAAGRFGHRVYPGDTLTADSTVIGLKENRTARPASSMCAPAASISVGRSPSTTAAG